MYLRVHLGSIHRQIPSHHSQTSLEDGQRPEITTAGGHL